MTAGETWVLDRLNEAERDILTLLAQGHTAKSIASLRGVTTAAVNERLRSARRKTGVGSSRELARLVIAQENRNDLIGLASHPLTSSPSIRPDASPQRRASFFRRWRLPMIAAATLALAFFLAQQTTTPSLTETTAHGDQVVSDIISHEARENNLAALHAEAASRSESQWSAATEARLTEVYQKLIPQSDYISLNVTCSATLCEIVGVTRFAVSSDDAFNLLSRLNDLMGRQKNLDGLENAMSRYGTNPAQPGTFVFLTYWRRA